jgi:hypothetical protein
LDGVHDSDECDCEMCVAAEEYEAREARKVSRAVQETENVSTASQDAGIDTPADARGLLWADAATIRAAIADVVDAGWQCGKGCDLRHPWMFPTEMFPGDEEPNANDIELRGKFIDAVTARLHELQSPPHNAPRLEQRCDSHKRRLLPAYSGECIECAKERLQ